MGLCNLVYACIDGVTFGHFARKAINSAAFKDNAAVKAAVVQSLTTLAVNAALVTTWANDIIHSGNLQLNDDHADDDDPMSPSDNGIRNQILGSIIAQCCLAAGLCSVLMAVITIGFIAYIPDPDIPDFIKNHSRKIGMPLLFLGGCIMFYFFSTYMQVVHTSDDDDSGEAVGFAKFVLGVELFVFVIFYLGLTYHAIKYSDMDIC